MYNVQGGGSKIEKHESWNTVDPWISQGPPYVCGKTAFSVEVEGTIR
jgi:hypothetical protein